MAKSDAKLNRMSSNARGGRQLLLQPNDPSIRVGERFDTRNDVSLFQGDCLALLSEMPSGVADLVITSPPYNVGKEYEQKQRLDEYLVQQATVISECIRVLSDRGSICWQVGNFVDRGAIIPLDILLYPVFAEAGLRMRNRIIWHFEHGLHCSRRLSGRYEVIIWFTKSNDYIFNIDPIRVPQKYPGKRHFKGPNAGKLSCNPLGKNPGDVWVIPNVKHNHVEKTSHPCQFPVELVERLVLSMTLPGSLVVDPYLGVGSTAVASIRHARKAAGAELDKEYYEIAFARIAAEANGTLQTRPMGRPVYQPTGKERVAKNPFLM